MANGYMKRCSNALLEKCKSKLQDTTSNLLGWLISTSTTKCFRGCGEKVPSFTAWECKLVQPLWNGMRVPQKIKHRGTIWPSSLSSGYLPENLKTFVHKDMCTPMFIAALFTVTKTLKQPVSPDRWLAKEDMVHIYNGTLTSHKKRGDTAIRDTMGEPWEWYAKWNKSDRKR